MSYGYLGVTPNQKVANNGVFSINEVNDLVEQGYWGGSLDLIEKQTISSTTATMNFTTLGDYPHHIVAFSNMESSYDGAAVMLRLSNDGGSSYESGASAYKWAYQRYYASSNIEYKDTADSSLKFYNGISDTHRAGGIINLYNLANSSRFSYINFQVVGIREGGSDTQASFGGGVYLTAETINAFQFLVDAGSGFDNLVARLYGVKQ